MSQTGQDGRTPRQIVLITRSEKGSPSLWDQLERAARLVSIVAIPVVLAVGGWWIQNALSQREVSKDYVTLAVSILSKSDQEGDNGLRRWAVTLLNANSSVKFSEETSKKLTRGELTLPTLTTGPFSPVAALPEGDPRRSLSRSIGKLMTVVQGQAQPLCTAWLVAVDQILTADYCLNSTDGPLSLHLEGAKEPAIYQVVSPALELDKERGFALLRVEGRPGEKHGVLTLSTVPPSPADSLFIAHYAQGGNQSFSDPCRVVNLPADDDKALHHDCDTAAGVGGAPLIRMSDRAVVGLQYMRATSERPALAKRTDAMLAGSLALRAAAGSPAIRNEQ